MSSDADDESEGDNSPFPDCPRCGKPVVFSVGTGPTTGSVGPCGCPVSPAALHHHREND